MGIIGAGRQSYEQLRAYLELFDFSSILVYDENQAATERFINNQLHNNITESCSNHLSMNFME